MGTALLGFPGFGVEYDETKNPYFKMIMVENLRLIASKPLGKQLLDSIAAAKPASRADFPSGVNVMCQPVKMHYFESGQKPQWSYGADYSKNLVGMAPSSHPKHNIKGCPFHISGTSFNEAVDQSQTAKGGTVCRMAFSNAQIIETTGAVCWPHIVLAHELIHSLHCLTGTHAGENEEAKTTGIGDFASEAMSENAMRKAFGLPERASYG